MKQFSKALLVATLILVVLVALGIIAYMFVTFELPDFNMVFPSGRELRLGIIVAIGVIHFLALFVWMAMDEEIQD